MTSMSDYKTPSDTVDAELPDQQEGVSEGRAKRILERRAGKVSPGDLRDMTERLRRKVSDLKDLEEGLHWIGTLIGRVKLLYGMIRDREFQVDLSTKLLVAGGLLYFILPTDLTPDFIPGIGYIDDAIILGTLWKMVADELERYMTFLRSVGREGEGLETLAFGGDEG